MSVYRIGAVHSTVRYFDVEAESPLQAMAQVLKKDPAATWVADDPFLDEHDPRGGMFFDADPTDVKRALSQRYGVEPALLDSVAHLPIICSVALAVPANEGRAYLDEGDLSSRAVLLMPPES